ncbi:MAG: FxLYD domain-containing protein [Thermoanaerobaculia bacterium]|nr:FxLYD domain-containing protein [Thermoanaerobaculia bacterium]
MHLSVPLALALLLQAAAVTPTPAPEPTLAPTPTPVARGLARPRTLQDVARERHLKTGANTKGTPRTITLGPAAGATPGVTPSASPEATGEPPAGAVSSAADVRVVNVTNDGIVDAAGGVRVTGTIRNAGDQTVCGVVILVRILDSRGAYLSSSQTPPDVTILPSGETTSFHTTVQAPPGIRGARVNPDRRDVTDGSTTMAGDWRLLGGAEAKVVDATPCPK